MSEGLGLGSPSKARAEIKDLRQYYFFREWHLKKLQLCLIKSISKYLLPSAASTTAEYLSHGGGTSCYRFFSLWFQSFDFKLSQSSYFLLKKQKTAI